MNLKRKNFSQEQFPAQKVSSWFRSFQDKKIYIMQELHNMNYVCYIYVYKFKLIKHIVLIV